MIHFHPQAQTDFSIRSFLDKASDLNHMALDQLLIIYIMDIRHMSQTYGSLVIDHDGNIYKSEWSTTRLINEFFSEFGYNYQRWAQFLKTTFNRPRTIFPYVNKNKVFIRVQQPNRKHSDWINLTLLKDINILTQTNNTVEIEKINFIFNIADGAKLSISISERTSLILSQIGYAFQLVNLWYEFQSDMIFEPAPLQAYIGNPAFKLFSEKRLSYKEQLKAKLDLDQFNKYNKIHHYLKHTTQRQYETVDTRLTLFQMHKRLFGKSEYNSMK